MPEKRASKRIVFTRRKIRSTETWRTNRRIWRNYREHYSKRSKEEAGKGQETEAGTDKDNGSSGPEGAPEANEGDRGRDSEDDGGDEGVARRREPGEDDEEVDVTSKGDEEFKFPWEEKIDEDEVSLTEAPAAKIASLVRQELAAKRIIPSALLYK